jgi:hypothetical protein
MSTGITFGFVIKNPHNSHLNSEDIITDTRIAQNISSYDIIEWK